MTGTELQTALSLISDLSQQVVIRAPANPVLSQILSLGSTASVTESGGQIVINLAPISTVFRITAPFDTALNEQLDNSNILGVDTTSEPGTSNFKIDT